jgi:uncharacterized DUF497 family protein
MCPSETAPAELGWNRLRGVYSDPVKYEWDPEKDRRNQRKHGVSFAEAATVFLDPRAATVPDGRFPVSEFRFRTIGYARTNRLLMVAHTERGDRIRIITARKATRLEREQYEH